MSQRLLERIQNCIVHGEYDLTQHAIEEMAKDYLSIFDVENAIFTGRVGKVATDDIRGPRYTIFGISEDGKTEVGVVGRFTTTDIFLVITVYEVTPYHE